MRSSLWARRVALVGASALIVATLAASPAYASGSTVVVTPSNLHDWVPYDNPGCLNTGENSTGSLTFVRGPAPTPLGKGSLLYQIGTTGNSYEQMRNPDYPLTPLTSLTELSYSSYVSNYIDGQDVYLTLYINWGEDTSTIDDALFFEPVYQTGAYSGDPVPNQGSVQLNTWQHWNALEGGWWANSDGFGGPPLHTLANYAAAHPGARIINRTSPALGGISMSAGCGAGAWDNFVGNADALAIGVSGTTTTYDFETDPQTLVVGSCQGPSPYTTIQSGVNAAAPGDTVFVCPGTYNETVTVATPNLTLQGNQHGVDARGGRPGATETILENGTFLLQADNLTLDGFTVQDNNGSNGYGVGIYTAGANSGFHILNDVVTNNVFGLYINSSGTYASTVSDNLLSNNNQSGPSSGNGIYADQGTNNTTIDSNASVNNSNAAIVIGATSPGTNSNIAVTNNTSSADGDGLYFLGVNGLTVANNTVTNSVGSAIALAGGDTNVSITGNTLHNTSNPYSGVRASDDGYGFGSNTSVTVTSNTITGFTYGIRAAALTNTLVASFNRIVGNSTAGIADQSTQAVDGRDNWWGCNGGPNATGCDMSTGAVAGSPWLVLKVTASPKTTTSTSTVTADTTHDSSNVDTSGSGHLPDGTTVSFTTTKGVLSSPSANLLGGKAHVVLSTGGQTGLATVTASLDNGHASTKVTLTQPGLSIGNASSTDGSSGTKTMTFTVKMSSASDQPVMVSYNTVDGTAISTASPSDPASPDYDAASGTLTFAPGVTSKTIGVTIHGYTVNEASETYSVVLSSPVGATITHGTGTGTILNDDLKPTLSIAGPAAPVTEGSPAVFTVTLSTVSDQTVTVGYGTVDGTASAGETPTGDYTASSGTLTFAPGETSKTVSVQTNADVSTRSSETFSMVLGSPVKATILHGRANATISS